MSHVELGTALGDLRERRTALRCELASVGHWRRLVRAKMDLTIARGAAPRPLSSNMLDSRPQHAALLPILDSLAQVPSEGFPLGELPNLRDLDAHLASYENDLRRELMALTDRLVEQLAEDRNHHALD
ncbi:hypothetical protein SAMN06309944_1171 [Micrococcales bacterium KH10]|nr:hypothetical protein SAMN06309944_1171 [Micrococcales bacterium KH10]